MLSESEIKTVISQTYAEVALQLDADMRYVADVFEAIRKQLYTSSLSDVWDYLVTSGTRAASLSCRLFAADGTDEKGNALNKDGDIDDIAVPLVWLREALLRALIRKQIEHLNELAAQHSPELSMTWYRFYADAAVHFREEFLCMLCLHRTHWEKEGEKLSHFSTLIHLLRENRWVDAFPYYEAIAADDSLDNKTKMMANVSLAEIIIYYYPDAAAADVYIKKAEALMPGASAVKRAQAQLFLKNKEYANTKSILLDVVYNEPSDFLALIYAGDCFLAEEALQQAETWYLDALQKNALQTETYRRLINLYANKIWYAERSERMYELVKRIEKRRPFRNTDSLVGEGLATPDCFANTELYHAYRDAAAGFYTNNDMDKAIDWYEKAIRLQPSLAVAMLDLAYLYIAIDKLPEARTYFDKALAVDPNNFDVHWGLAYYFEKAAQKEAALHSYEKCLQLRPGWSDWVYNLIGNLYYSYKEFETAATYFRMSVAENNNIAVYRQNLADALTNAALAYAEKGTPADQEQAAAFYREAAQISDNAEAWNKLGNFHFARGEWEEAIAGFSKALSMNDKEPVYYGNLASVYENLNQAEQVEDWYRKAIEADKGNGRYLNRLGIFYYNRNEYSKAIEAYQQAVECEPANADYLNNLSVACKDSGQTGRAIESLKALLALSPGNDTLWNNIGVMYFDIGDAAEAIEHYQKAMSLDNTKPLYYQNLGLAYEKEANPQEAIRVYEKALQLHQQEAYFLNAIGLVYYRGEDYQKALSCFQKAAAKEDSNWLYNTNLGLAFSKTGNTDEAIQAYRKALQLNENDYLNWNELGLLLRAKEQYADAIDAYRKAIALEPTDANVSFNLAVSCFLSGDTDEANRIASDARLSGEMRDNLLSFFAGNSPDGRAISNN